jgi:hypothetical protein
MQFRVEEEIFAERQNETYTKKRWRKNESQNNEDKLFKKRKSELKFLSYFSS